VDIAWRDGKLTEATIRSLRGDECRIATMDNVRVIVDGQPVILRCEDDGIAFSTEEGKAYVCEC